MRERERGPVLTAKQMIHFCRRLEPAKLHSEDADTARLVTRLQSGDEQAFTTLYARYFDRVYGHLRTLLKDPHEAEDAAQEVFVRVFRMAGEFEFRGAPFRAWLFQIVRNYALRQLRTHGRTDVEDPAEIETIRAENGQAADLHALDWMTDHDLVFLIERLPLAQRQVIVLRHFLGFSNAEVAEVLGRSNAAIRQLHQRAVVFLKARLTSLGRDPRNARRRTPMREVFRPVWALRARRFALTKWS